MRRGLWRNNEGTREGKYSVKRRDGTVPEWPLFVLGAKDPAAPAALRAYAQAGSRLGFHADYVQDILALADEFESYRNQHGEGDPDAPKHRADDPATVASMREGRPDNQLLTIPRENLSPSRMKGSSLPERAVLDGCLWKYQGIGWIRQGNASDSDYRECYIVCRTDGAISEEDARRAKALGLEFDNPVAPIDVFD